MQDQLPSLSKKSCASNRDKEIFLHIPLLGQFHGMEGRLHLEIDAS